MITSQNYHYDLVLRCQTLESNYLVACSNPSLSQEEIGFLEGCYKEAIAEFEWFMCYVVKNDIEPEDKLDLN